MIPYGRHEITKDDIDAVVEVLKSDFLTQGNLVPEFENTVAEYCKALHGVAVNSATSALHIACLALGLGKGDILWTSPITFVASANCARYCGADVDFVDIDKKTYNMSPLALEKKLIDAEKKGRLPKIVVPVHLCGQSCDMKAIFELSKRFGFKIIEDASHAIGGRYNDEPIGGCTYCDITIFSFHPVKIVTTGEGGMAVTNSKELAEQMSLLRSHGVTRDKGKMTHEPDGPWYYQQIDLGFNYRMTDIQAALGISQFKRIDEIVNRRHAIADKYFDRLSNYEFCLPWQHPDTYSAFHLFPIKINSKSSSISRGDVFSKLRCEGIGVNVHYIPVHTQPYYKGLGFSEGDYPNAEEYYESAISLPMFPTLQEEQIDYIVDVCAKCF